jgi:nucleotide-binding universal stress UspA family protein
MSESGTPTTIVVGVNGSPSSLRALAWAHRQARLTGGDLHAVLSTWTIPVDHSGAPAAEGPDRPELARTVLDEAIDEAVGHAGTDRIHRHVVPGHPVRVLLAAGADADLLVVGGGGDGPGTALSPLCQDLVSRAPCPVVVVRGPESAAESLRTAGAPSAGEVDRRHQRRVSFGPGAGRRSR